MDVGIKEPAKTEEGVVTAEAMYCTLQRIVGKLHLPCQHTLDCTDSITNKLLLHLSWKTLIHDLQPFLLCQCLRSLWGVEVVPLHSLSGNLHYYGCHRELNLETYTYIYYHCARHQYTPFLSSRRECELCRSYFIYIIMLSCTVKFCLHAVALPAYCPASGCLHIIAILLSFINVDVLHYLEGTWVWGPDNGRGSI